MKMWVAVVLSVVAGAASAGSCDELAAWKVRLGELQRTQLPPLPPTEDAGYVNAKTEELVLSRKVARAEAQIEMLQPVCVRQSKPPARIGMSKDQVIKATQWGEPDTINTTTTSEGTSEQWVYGDGHYLYFRNGRLTAIQARK